MNNGSDVRAVRPIDHGQRQSENQAFGPLAEYLAKVYRACQSREPIPPPPPNLPIPRVPGRDILFRMLDAIGQGAGIRHIEEFAGSLMYVNKSAGKALFEVIQSHRTSNAILFSEAARIAHGFRLRAKRYGHPKPNGVQYVMESKADIERIRDTLHFDDTATKRFEHYAPSAGIVRKPPEPIPTRDENLRFNGKPKAKSKPARVTKSKADPKPGKAARAAKPDGKSKADPKPAKAAETFAKMFDWVHKLDISSTSKIIMVEIIRKSHDRPFSWVGNVALANVVQKSKRQVIRILRNLDAAGHITIRDYKVEWVKTQRLIFVNRLAESAGIDPKSIGLPESQKEFWKFRNSFNGKDKSEKPKRMSTAKA